MKDYIAPNPSIRSFTCPHCGSFALHQTLPIMNNKQDQNVYLLNDSNGKGIFGENEIFVFRRCCACNKTSILKIKGALVFESGFKSFREFELVYPKIFNATEPNPDMPEEIKAFFNEARSVSNNSTRAATALLRIATEKLVKDLLGLKGSEYANTKMHQAIERLYKEKNLNTNIYKALMSLKLFGNEASHPNEDLSRLESYFSNDKDLMNKLFSLLNLIVDDLISKPKQIEELFNSAPRKKQNPDQ